MADTNRALSANEIQTGGSLASAPPGVDLIGTLSSVSTGVNPAGAIVMFAGSTAPVGWLLCDGSAVSRSVFSSLFGVLGIVYGAGDGVSTFNLPDMRGRVPVGLGSHADVSALNANDGVALANRTPKHNSTVTDPTHTHQPRSKSGAGGGSPQFDYTPGVNGSYVSGGGGSEDFVAPVASATGITVGPGGTRAVDAPAYIVVSYVIKT